MSDVPPVYTASSSSLPCPPNLPQYTQCPGEHERVLNSEPSSPVIFALTRTRHCVSKSDHLEIDLGQFPVTLMYPAYGYNGVVEGMVRFTKDCSYVTEVTVKLEGTLTTTASEHATVAVPSVTKNMLLSNTSTLVPSNPSTSGGYRCIFAGAEYPFSIPFPTYISGQDTPLPPSYTAFQPGVCTQVEYFLQVDLVRKGIFRRHEVRKIPVLYLPKTRPPVPPLTEIPQNSLETLADRVKGIDLPRIWPQSCTPSTPCPYTPSVQLFVPFPRCFTSGEFIPLGLSVNCPASAALVQLYTSDISVLLVKRTKIWTVGPHPLNIRDIILSAGQLVRRDDAGDGKTYMTYVLEAGKVGRETSWAVEKFIEVSYMIRVVMRPLKKLELLPVFRRDEVVQLTTDAFDTLGIESLTGGISEPAIGLTTLRSVLTDP